MKRTPLGDYRVLLGALILGYVDSALREMVADGIPDPVGTLYRLLADSTGEDAIAKKYGPRITAIRSTFVYEHNAPLVEVTIRECIAIAGSLL